MKNKVLLTMLTAVAIFSQNAYATGNHIQIFLQGEALFPGEGLGGPRKLMEIYRFSHDISDKFDELTLKANQVMRQKLEQQLPSSLELDSLSIGIQPYAGFEFASDGNGAFSAQTEIGNIYGRAKVELDGFSFLGYGTVSFNTNFIRGQGNYNLWNGIADVTVDNPNVVVSVDYGGLGLELINFVTFGYLDDLVDDFEADLQSELDVRVEDIIETEVNSYSTTLFGISGLLEQELFNNYPEIPATIQNQVTGEIRDLVEDIPAGNIVSVDFRELVNEWNTEFNLSVGNNLRIRLTHDNPNGQCTGSCRN